MRLWRDSGFVWGCLKDVTYLKKLHLSWLVWTCLAFSSNQFFFVFIGVIGDSTELEYSNVVWMFFLRIFVILTSSNVLLWISMWPFIYAVSRLCPQLEKREENNLAGNPSGSSPVVTFLMWVVCVVTRSMCTPCPSEVTECLHLLITQMEKSSTLLGTWKKLYWSCSYCAPSFKNIPPYHHPSICPPANYMFAYFCNILQKNMTMWALVCVLGGERHCLFAKAFILVF